jgi:hypothetical protein
VETAGRQGVGQPRRPEGLAQFRRQRHHRAAEHQGGEQPAALRAGGGDQPARQPAAQIGDRRWRAGQHS